MVGKLAVGGERHAWRIFDGSADSPTCVGRKTLTFTDVVGL